MEILHFRLSRLKSLSDSPVTGNDATPPPQVLLRFCCFLFTLTFVFTDFSFGCPYRLLWRYFFCANTYFLFLFDTVRKIVRIRFQCTTSSVVVYFNQILILEPKMLCNMYAYGYGARVAIKIFELKINDHKKG